MSISISNFRGVTNTVMAGPYSLGVDVEKALTATSQKMKNIVEGIVGLAVGTQVHKIYMPLTEKILQMFGTTFGLSFVSGSDPFSELSLGSMIWYTPLVCVLGPVCEEKMFRGDLQGALKSKFESFYVNRGFSNSAASTAARVTAVFFASIIFGLVHFTNAICFWCNPILFLPQVVAATLMGLLFGFAKEFSGGLYLPIGMHMGNNILAWASYIQASL